MAFEIEYKLHGGDPHVYRVNRRFESCEDALSALRLMLDGIKDYECGPGMVLSILWVE